MRNSEIVIPPEYEREAVKVILPVSYIWGTQTPCEYSSGRAKSIRNAVTERGVNFYLDNPIIIGLLPYENGSVLFLLNGHHRTREASKFNIFSLPSLIFSLSLLAQLAGVEEAEYKQKIEQWTSGAIQEFEHHYKANKKNYYPPRILAGVTTLEELTTITTQNNSVDIKDFSILENRYEQK